MASPRTQSGFFLQSTFGSKGNFELVVPGARGGIAHYWRDNDHSGLIWNGPAGFGTGNPTDLTMVQSNFGPGNLELVGREGANLVFYWRSNGAPWSWGGPFVIAGNAGGAPALIQSSFGARGNFELVVPRTGGGLAHYWRDNDDPALPWHGPAAFGLGAVSGVSMIQSNFGPGNLELVARVGRELVFYWRTTGPSWSWSGPFPIASGVTGTPSLIQSSFGDRGNFELVVGRAGGGLAHYWRDNDTNGYPWHGPTLFGTGNVTAVSLFQSNFGPGNLELIALEGPRIAFYWRDGAPSFAWHGPFYVTGAKHIDVNLILVGNDNFTSAHQQQALDSLEGTRKIYAQVGLGIGAVSWYGIPASDAGSYEVIDNGSEASDLTSDWTVHNDALDVFVVRSMTDADGRSPVGGPCDKDEKGMTGSVVSLNGNVANSSNTFAHEMGHYLGLDHIPDAGNFIGDNGASNSNTGIYDWQGDTMKKHCFVKAG